MPTTVKQYQPILRAGGLLLLFCLFFSGVARPAEKTDEQIQSQNERINRLELLIEELSNRIQK